MHQTNVCLSAYTAFAAIMDVTRTYFQVEDI